MTCFYPEMNETAPATALVIGSYMRDRVYVKWAAASHDTVMSVLSAKKIATKHLENYTSIHGEKKWSATMTQNAYTRLQATGITASELLLD